MPKIHLKPRSPEFADAESRKPVRRACDMPGCACEGEYKAPKAREGNDYFWFCLEHVQEYNKAWDYFSGMSHSEIEEHIIRGALWDRPTRPFRSYADLKDELYRKARQTYEYKEKNKEEEAERKRRMNGISRQTPEYEAMAIMGLEPPLDLAALKTRYKELVKKFHPDINRDDPAAEDVLKSVNMAYTILKIAHEKYAKIAGET